MQLLKLSEATAAYRKILFFAFDDDAADAYAPLTGLTFAAGELKWKKAGVAEANAAGTATEVGGGWYEYEATAGELDTLGVALMRTNKADVYSEGVPVQVVAFNPYSAADLGLSRIDAAVSTRFAAGSYESPTVVLTNANGVETGLSLAQAITRICAMTAGKRTGIGSGIEYYYDNTGTTAIVTATIDSSGNTTAITYGTV